MDFRGMALRKIEQHGVYLVTTSWGREFTSYSPGMNVTL